MVNGKGKVLDEVGMAENINTGIKITVEEFEAGLKKLAKIKPEEALDYLDEALIYFNHHIVEGKIVQISNTNCINVVQSVEDFLRTGKITKAISSKPQGYFTLAEKYKGTFLTYNFSTLNKVIKDGERGILLCERGEGSLSHVLNIIKKDGKLNFVDGQVYSQKVNLSSEFKSFKFLKIN